MAEDPRGRNAPNGATGKGRFWPHCLMGHADRRLYKHFFCWTALDGSTRNWRCGCRQGRDSAAG